MPSTPAGIELKSGVVQQREKAIETNWRIKYGMKHSQQCFAIANATLKLDPFDQSGLPV